MLKFSLSKKWIVVTRIITFVTLKDDHPSSQWKELIYIPKNYIHRYVSVPSVTFNFFSLTRINFIFIGVDQSYSLELTCSRYELMKTSNQHVTGSLK